MHGSITLMAVLIIFSLASQHIPVLRGIVHIQFVFLDDCVALFEQFKLAAETALPLCSIFVPAVPLHCVVNNRVRMFMKLPFVFVANIFGFH